MQSAFAFRLALVLTTLALGAGPASAQTSGQVSPSGSTAAARADALFREGNSAVKQQKWAEAEMKFAAAFALNRSYDVAVNLGQTQYRLGKYRDAAENLAFALRSWPLTGRQEQRDLAVKRLEELRKLVGTVTIHVSVPGATVLLDGKELGPLPLGAEVFVDPGTRVIEAKRDGYEAATATVDIAAGSSREVLLQPVKIVSTSGGASARRAVVKDGVEGAAATRKGSSDGTTGVSAGAGGNASGERNKGLIIAGFATSAALVGTGIAFAVKSAGKGSDANEIGTDLQRRTGRSMPCEAANVPECADIRGLVADQELFANLAVWTLVTGGALAAGTAIYALSGPRTPTKSAVRVAPIAASRAGGLVLTGTW